MVHSEEYSNLHIQCGAGLSEIAMPVRHVLCYFVLLVILAPKDPTPQSAKGSTMPLGSDVLFLLIADWVLLLRIFIVPIKNSS